MTHRFLVRSGVLAVPLAVLWLATVSLAGQTAPSAAAKAKGTAAKGTAAKSSVKTTAAKPYTPPRTPDGQPDIQGFWTNSSYTPLERPDNVTKDFYTPAELEVAIKQAADRESAQTTPGTTADVHYDFTQFGLDRNQSTFAKNLRTSLIVNPENGKMPPVTPEGQKRAADRAAARKALGGTNDAVENMAIGSRCIIMGGAGPPMMNAGYNANYQIVQGSGYVMILTEMIHDVRIIPLDGRPQPHENVRQWVGSSRGRWEGNTLVVETANYNGKNPFRGASDKMKVTERFTRVSADSITYTFTIDDDATWARPWTAEMPMQKMDGPLFEFACHETNYGIANILAGARAEEKRAAEAKAK